MNSTQHLANVLKHLNKLQLNNDHDDHDDHDHDHNKNINDNDDNKLIIAKATAMTVLFCASTLCGSIPFLLNRWFKWTDDKNTKNARSATIIKCLLYFGGGVLLCTTFLHLLPEVRENIEELQSQNIIKNLSFHLPELLMCLGFFAMYLVEEIIHSYIHKQTKKDLEQMAFERGRSIQNSFLVRNNNQQNNNNNNDKICNKKLNEKLKDIENIENIDDNNKLCVKDLIKNDIENQKYETNNLQNQDNNNHHDHNDRQMITQSSTTLNGNNNKNNQHHQHQHNHHHHHSHNDHNHGHSHNIPAVGIDENTIVSSLRGLLIVLALSLHELFEGLAVGLESETKKVWYMFAAVSAHKLVLAFCVGVELLVTRTRLWLAIIYVITFAIVSPMGIGIGIGISNQNSATSAIPSAILQGLATGTLLYVVFFEILSKERSGFKAYLAFIIGFSLMFGLQFATNGHEHSHSSGHSHDHHDEHDDDHDHKVKNIEDQIKLLRAAAKDFITK